LIEVLFLLIETTFWFE